MDCNETVAKAAELLDSVIEINGVAIQRFNEAEKHVHSTMKEVTETIDTFFKNGHLSNYCADTIQKKVVDGLDKILAAIQGKGK